MDPRPTNDEYLTASTIAGGTSRRRRRAPLERGSCAGRYVILDQLGEGGMGIVYKAYDPELDRPIALKLMNTDEGLSADVIRERLVREAQALARLSHPNVIAVHDVGTFERDVFIAMEFVEGSTLRDWLKDKPRSQREILDVFAAAGEGLAAAHRAGLVHRDFKPDNVIVGNDGRVRVLDFGLARGAATADASDETPASPSTLRSSPGLHLMDISASGLDLPPSRLSTPLTCAGSIMGTPRFMAPEQHNGETVDERADQFSFCVALYEALYGALPFAGSTPPELRENVLAGRVADPPPSARVPRWRRKVLVRGIARDPDDRHPSMTVLLTALRADPGRARNRWLSRGAVALLVAAAAVGWRVQARQQRRACTGAADKLAGVWDDARRHAVRAAFAASGKSYAAPVLRTVEQIFDAYAESWRTMHVDACEATHVRGEQSQELLDLRMACLDDRLTQLATLTNLYSSSDGALVERAVQTAQSLPSINRCADTAALRAPVPPPRDPDTQRRVADVRLELARANALDLAGQYDEGLRLARGALAVASSLQYSPLLAEAQLRLGQLQGDHGDYAEATRSLHRAFVAALGGRYDEVVAWAAIYLIQANGDHAAHYDEAERWSEVAEAAVGRLSRNDDLSGTLFAYRSVLRKRQGRYADALSEAKRSLELEQRAFGPNHPRVGQAYQNLGKTEYYLDHYAEALHAFEGALRIDQRALGPDHPQVTRSLVGMADVYGDMGEHARAIAEYRRALALFARVQPDHPTVATINNNLGDELESLGRFDEARECFERALSLWQKTLGPSHQMVTALHNLGELALDMKRPEEAVRYFEQALAMAEKVLGPTHPMRAWPLWGIGEARRLMGRYDEALPWLERSLAITEQARGKDSSSLGNPLLSIGRLQLGRHLPDKALPPLERAYAIISAPPARPYSTAEVGFVLAQALWATGDHARAIRLATQARDAYEKAEHLKPRLAEVTAWLQTHR